MLCRIVLDQIVGHPGFLFPLIHINWCGFIHFFIIAHSLTLMYKHSTQHFLVTNQVAVRYWYLQHAHTHEDDSAGVVFFKKLTSFDFGYSCVHNSSENFVIFHKNQTTMLLQFVT